MHGLARSTCAVARPRHRGHGVPARSRARGSTASRTSRCATCRSSCTSPDAERGHARPRRRRRASTRPAGAPRPCCGSPTRSPTRSTRASSPTSTSGSSGRSCACSREMEDAGIRIDREFLDELRHRARRAVRRRSSAEIHAHAGEDVQRQLDAAAAPDPVREARAHAGEEDEDRPVDRRRLAPEDGRRAPDRRRPPAVPRGREAAQHLRRRAAAARSAPTAASTRRSTRSPPPPAASRARNPNLQNIPVRTADGREMRRAFVADDGLRACSPPTTRRSSCGCSRTSPRTPA